MIYAHINSEEYEKFWKNFHREWKRRKIINEWKFSSHFQLFSFFIQTQDSFFFFSLATIQRSIIGDWKEKLLLFSQGFLTKWCPTTLMKFVFIRNFAGSALWMKCFFYVPKKRKMKILIYIVSNKIICLDKCHTSNEYYLQTWSLFSL
jgi:hypothetical protein